VKRPAKNAKSNRSKSSSENTEASNGEQEEKKKKKKKAEKRPADPKLVPRKAEPERWEPKRRKDEKEASPASPPPKRKAVAARSRSRDSSPSARSEEAPPKKRAANALSVPTEQPRALAVSLTRAAAREEDKRSEEAARARRPAQEAARNRPQARDGEELLRRVLRANLCPGKRAQAGNTRPTKDGEPRATLVPPSRKDASSEEESARSTSPPRGVATLRPPKDRAGKAEGRKPRRV